MIADPQDTIVALSSAPGPGARAIIRLSGSQALSIVAPFFAGEDCIHPKRRHCYAGQLRVNSLSSPLPIDLHFWPAPRTYTGQEIVELHMISCPPLVDLLIAQLLNAGARAAQPGEFTLRAFLAGKLDLTRAEAVLGVIEAGNRDQLKQALEQLAGGVTQPLQRLRDDLLNLLADLEANLDFSEEDIRFVKNEELLQRVTAALAQLRLLEKQLDRRTLADRPFRVVLVGRPNAGKSSLFNALLDLPAAERNPVSSRNRVSGAIVSPEPGTTRDYLIRRLNFDGIPIELVDTAGLQPPLGVIEEQAQGLGKEVAVNADLLLLCLEVGKAVSDQESGIMTKKGPPAVEVITTKCDLGPRRPHQLATSAVTGAGVEALRALIADHARTHAQPPLAPSVSRCRHHVEACVEHLRRVHESVLFEEPLELVTLELRGAVDQLGEMVGAVYTDDLLDRIFSRFCIGK